jgi:ferredoxin
MPKVEFLDWGKKVEVGKYANLRKVALLHDVQLYKGIDRLANCLGNGLCGTCTVQVVEGAENLTPKTLREQFKLKHRPENIRLACQCQVLGDVCVITNQALTYEDLYAKAQPQSAPAAA